MAVSIAEPPPTATNASHGPSARAQAIAACMLSSVGSTCAPSYTHGLDAELRHLVGDPLRVTGRGHARVGDHERATHGVLERS